MEDMKNPEEVTGAISSEDFTRFQSKYSDAIQKKHVILYIQGGLDSKDHSVDIGFSQTLGCYVYG